MKILKLSWEFPPYAVGGLGRHVAELSPALAKEGVEVHLLVPSPEPAQPSQILQANLTIHWVSTVGIDTHLDIYERVVRINEVMFERANKLWSVMGPFDLIHAHDWLVSFVAKRLKIMYNCPLVVTFHATEQGRWRNHFPSNDLSRKIDEAEKELSIEAWRVIACSHYMVEELQRLFAISIDRLDMISNGINLDTKTTYSPEYLAEFRATYALPEQPIIFSVGRLVYEKGYQVLLDAMPMILNEIPTTKLVLAGKGPLFDELQQHAQELGIWEHVHFVGFISDEDRDKLFSVANCAVFPSLYEPFGIVALEAMAYACPVVASNVGGLTEVIDHKKTGTLIYSDDPGSAAWGVLEVLKNPETAASYASNAKQMVAEKYNWQRIANKTKQVYHGILAQHAQIE